MFIVFMLGIEPMTLGMLEEHPRLNYRPQPYSSSFLM